MEVLAQTQRVSLASFNNTPACHVRRPVFISRSQFCGGNQPFESAVSRQVLTASTSRRGDALILRCQGSNGAAAAPWAQKDARLVLEDGSVWEGRAFGTQGTALAEVVFNTSLTGYQEILTDPSYKGQFVVFTHPHIGNVGINFGDMESEKCHLGGIIIRDLSASVSNYRSTKTVDEYLKEQGVLGIADVDTRAITRRLRDTGALNGIITTDMTTPAEELVQQTKSWSILGKDLIREVTCSEPYEWKDTTEHEWEFNPNVLARNGEQPFHIVAYDFGIKHNILRRLASFGCRLTVVPADYPASKVLEMNPDGVFLSNGPGDPSAVPYAVENVRQVLGKKPVFGICMGHQLLGQAFGGETFKLKFGHHGGNHPIRYAPTSRIEISAQNHNYAVNPETLPADVEVTHINLNDGTCAGLLCKPKKAMSIQYHPEASPGPHDADVCFEQFIEMLKEERAGKAAVAA
ncbi:g3871 [Coccomyxa elongata]